METQALSTPNRDEAWQKVLNVRKAVDGWTFEDKSLYLFDLVLEQKPALVVEVGVWRGLSISSFCAASLITGTKVWAVDPWSEEAMAENGYNQMLSERQYQLDAIADQFRRDFKVFGLDRNLTILRKTSWDASFDFADSSIDILHLDGAHMEWDSARDFIAWTPKIKKGGLFIMDDANWETMQLCQVLALKKYEHVTYIENGKTRVLRKK